MQTYKISTLGENFVFISQSISEAHVALPEVSIEKGGAHVIRALPDMCCDYRISASGAADIFAPDLSRAVLIFLYVAKGLPRSEYEIIYNSDEYPITLCENNFGGNVGKCKLLFSKHREKSENGAVDFHCIEAPQGNYAFIMCERTELVDMKKLTACAIAECGSLATLRGIGAISYSDGNAVLVFRGFDNASVPDTSVYAAAAFLLSELLGESRTVIATESFRVCCLADSLGVRVYDLCPTVSKHL